MRCKKHPNYKGERKPTTNCEACCIKYLNDNFGDISDLTIKEVTNILEMISSYTGAEQLLLNLEINEE